MYHKNRAVACFNWYNGFVIRNYCECVSFIRLWEELPILCLNKGDSDVHLPIKWESSILQAYSYLNLFVYVFMHITVKFFVISSSKTHFNWVNGALRLINHKWNKTKHHRVKQEERLVKKDYLLTFSCVMLWNGHKNLAVFTPQDF